MAFRLSENTRMLRRSSTWPVRLACAGVLLVLSMSLSTAPTQAAERSSLEASSSKAIEEAAIRSIPWNQLSQQDRRVAQYIVRNKSVFRRMPTRVIRCRPEVFTLLAKRPEVISSVWNVMGVSQLQLTRLSENTFRASDQVGTQGSLRVLHANYGPEARNRVLVYAEGVYEAKPLPRPIKARSLLFLQSASTVESDGNTYVTARLDSFVHFDHTATDLVARTLSPLLNRTADHNFVETMRFVSTFSQTTEKNPSGVARLADRLQDIDPVVRDEIVSLCEKSASANWQANRQQVGRVRVVQAQDRSSRPKQ